MRVSSRALWVALLLVAGSPAYALSQDEERTLRKASTFVTKGNRALRIGNLRKAETQFARALGVQPDLPEGHLGMGHVFMQRKQFGEALSAYLEAESAYSRNSASLHDYYRRRYTEAQARATDIQRRVYMMGLNVEWLESTTLESGDPGSARQRGKLRTVQEDLRKSEGEVQRLESVAPPPEKSESGVPGAVYFFIGNALLRLNRLEEAVEAWETCAGVDSSSPLVHNNLAVAYWKLGRMDSAMSSLEKAEALGFEVNPRFKIDLARSVERPEAPDAGRARRSGESHR